MLGCATPPVALAQAGNTAPIRVGSERVMVPVFVANKEHRSIETSAFKVADFHLLEDGQEQKIQSVATERTHMWEVDDNLGRHIEYSNTPRGKWSTADLSFTSFAGVDATRYYLIGYQPPPSAIGSCHHIEVRLDRDNMLAYSRSEYCNVQHSASDILDGTKFGSELEHDLASEASGQIRLNAQTRVFGGDLPRVYVSIDFPWESLERRWIDGSLFATIGVAGKVFRKDGSVAAQFSDQACCSSDVPSFVLNEHRLAAHPEFDVMLIPNRYETQLSLAPGEYVLRVALSDGKKFGRAVVPLTVESHDEKLLAVSEITLCAQYHEVSATARSAALFPADYVPFVSKSLEVTPAMKNAFKSNKLLAAYFEIYRPGLPTERAEPVTARIRIVNSKTGQIISELDAVKAEAGPNSSGITIPMAQFIPIKTLPKGEYRLEVEATDDKGQSSAKRATNFVLDR
jgi:hypothetical protein